MKRFLKILGFVLLAGLLAGGATVVWYLHTKQAQRSGTVDIANLRAPVTVRYDERGVPHIEAANEACLCLCLCLCCVYGPFLVAIAFAIKNSQACVVYMDHF